MDRKEHMKMAGKFMNKILNIIGLEENILDEKVDLNASNEDAKTRNELEETTIQYNTRQKKGKIVNLHASPSMKVIIYQPLTYDDTQSIIDNLKEHKPVIVNLESLEVELGQRVLDFISGAVYSLGGNIQKVSKGIFLLVPSNVDISGNIPDELKGKNFFTLTGKRE